MILTNYKLTKLHIIFISEGHLVTFVMLDKYSNIMWTMKSGCSTEYELLMITSNAHTQMHMPAATCQIAIQSVAYSNV
jgi:hypothetical protein